MVMSCVSKLLLEGDVDGEPDAALSLSLSIYMHNRRPTAKLPQGGDFN